MAGGILDRVIVQIPPRHGKSVFLSEYVPGWWLGTFPSDRAILATYGADFSATWGRKARDHFSEYGRKVFGHRIREDVQAANEWEIAKHGGSMYTVGVLGPITGRGANLFLIDDPIKNDREALSVVYRDHVWDWYQSTAYTRLEPGAKMLITQARWHDDDLVGRLLKEQEKGGDKWHVINLPAIAEEEDAIGRKPGEALWPVRYDEEALAKRRRVVKEFWWNALFQGHPLPAGGGLFKRESFRYFAETDVAYLLYDATGQIRKVWEKSACWLFATVDLAVSTKTSADFTVICVWAVTPEYDLLLIDMERQRLEHPDQGKVIWGLQIKHGSRFASIDIENTQYQLGLVQELLRQGLPVVGIKADRDKLARALPAAARAEGGKLYFRTSTEWVNDVEAELLVFSGKNDLHDDIVDNFSLAARRIALGEVELDFWSPDDTVSDFRTGERLRSRSIEVPPDLMQTHVDRLYQGQPIPWDTLSEEDADHLDSLLALHAAELVEHGDPLRGHIFLQERKRRRSGGLP